MNSLFYIVVMILILGFAPAIDLTSSAIAQGDIQSAQPSSLNMTGNSTGNITTLGEEDIPTANQTDICLNCWYPSG